MWAPKLDKTLLSPRERQVGDLAVLGFSSSEIGRRLFIGVRTVETHLKHIYDKVGVRSRAQLTAWWPWKESEEP